MKHHAYLATGALTDWQALKQEYLAKKADLCALTYEILGIHEARELRRQQASAGRTFLIYFAAITLEAQNALLKMLEEPSRDNAFILITANPALLLPTLLSRTEKLELAKNNLEGRDENLEILEKFVRASLSERLVVVNKIETKGAALQFLNDLEKYLAKNMTTQNGAIHDVMRAIWTGREYLHDKSGTVKLVLEHIALVL